MGNEELREFVFALKDGVNEELKFTGFSTTAIDFFNDMPSKYEAPKWLRKKKEAGDFDILKSEFIDLVHDLCKILCLADAGFEDDFSGNKIIGRETKQGQDEPSQASASQAKPSQSICKLALRARTHCFKYNFPHICTHTEHALPFNRADRLDASRQCRSN